MIYTTYKYKLDKGDADDDYPMPFFKVIKNPRHQIYAIV